MRDAAMAMRSPEIGGETHRPMTGHLMVGLKRLRVSEFRSIAEADLSFGAGPIVFVGPNGAGKTNLLEAISFLAPGRGLHQAKLAEVTRRGSNSQTGWAVSAEIGQAGEAWRIGTGLARDELGRDRRRFRLEGEPAHGADIGELVRIVWLTPALERLFEDSGGARRRFLDRLTIALEPGHAARLAAYERAQSGRLRLLKEERAEPEWLAGLEAIAAREGVAIAAARLRTIDALSRAISDGDLDTEQQFPRAALALDGALETELRSAGAADVEEHLRAALSASRARDAAAGRALLGPHRSDLKVTHRQTNMPAELASTGEQKGLLLNILLAHARLLSAEKGHAPIVLLDEVAAHLDGGRRAALFAALAGFGAQIFLSGSDERAFADLSNAQVFTLERGQLRAPTPMPFPRTEVQS
jgi:DNA replication and repair protein RecF